MQCLGGSPGHCTSQHLPAPALHMLSFENFVKSMPPGLSELKVTPSFCFAFKIPDDRAVTITYITLEIFKGDQKKSGAKPKGLQLSKDQITSSQRGILIYKLVWDWNKWGFCFCHMFFFVTVLLNLIGMSYESTRKGSSVATPKGIFYKIQWAWQGVK